MTDPIDRYGDLRGRLVEAGLVDEAEQLDLLIDDARTDMQDLIKQNDLLVRETHDLALAYQLALDQIWAHNPDDLRRLQAAIKRKQAEQ